MVQINDLRSDIMSTEEHFDHLTGCEHENRKNLCVLTMPTHLLDQILPFAPPRNASFSLPFF